MHFVRVDAFETEEGGALPATMHVDDEGWMSQADHQSEIFQMWIQPSCLSPQIGLRFHIADEILVSLCCKIPEI